METRGEAGGPARLADESTGMGLEWRGVVAFVVALLVPGAGHVMLGRWRRGVLLAVVLLGTFALGLALHGRLHTVDPSSLLSLFFVFADAGSGLVYLACLLLDIGIKPEAAQATFEYGTQLLAATGLLNYLVALDAYDIAVGRKP